MPFALRGYKLYSGDDRLSSNLTELLILAVIIPAAYPPNFPDRDSLHSQKTSVERLRLKSDTIIRKSQQTAPPDES